MTQPKPNDQLSKIMIAFDVETTGKNPDTDQIVEISMCLYEGGREDGFYQLIRPDVPIAKGAQAVHGISMEDVAEMPSFHEVADEIEEFLGRADVFVGYNVRFDIRCVEQEFERIGRTIDLSSKLVVDPYRIWQSLEPRSLSDAYRRFVGQELENAHSAEADVQAAVDVLRGIRRTFNLEEASWEELAKMTNPEKDLWIGPSHQFVWSAGEVVFGFGKYNGRPLFEVATRDAGYLRWIQGADFPPHVKSLCKGALSGLSEEDFNARIVEHFGAPPPIG
ncbi:3'-5' exonuclease [bacterium]|nr:3'-5' exonuclease [bacterium]